MEIHLPGPIPLRLTLFSDDRDALGLCSSREAINVRLVKSWAFGEKAHNINPKKRAEFKREDCVDIATWRKDADDEPVMMPPSTRSSSRPGYRIVLHGELKISGLEPTLDYRYGPGTGIMAIKVCEISGPSVQVYGILFVSRDAIT